MNSVDRVLTFIFGAGVGAAAAWYFAKQKYEAISLDERESYKKYYEEQLKKLEPIFPDYKNEAGESGYAHAEPGTHDDITSRDIASMHPACNKKDISEYVKNIKSYTNYSDRVDEETTSVVNEPVVDLRSETPYVISPDDFGEYDDYNTISLLYFADEILTDDDYSIIENVNDIVGIDSLGTFGEYEDDAVHVRNDRLKCDYEILKDERRFEDIKLARLRNGLD